MLGSKATDALIGDLLYIKNNYEQFSTDVKISDNQAWELGRRTAGAIFELEQAGFTVISFSSALKGARNVAKGTGNSVGAARRLTYEASPKHGATAKGSISAAPRNGQEALDLSIQVKSTSPRRISIDYKTGEFNVFDQTSSGVFHGHVRT